MPGLASSYAPPAIARRRKASASRWCSPPPCPGRRGRHRQARRPGGAASKAPLGRHPRGRRQTSPDGAIIPSSTSPGTMRLRSPPGPAAGCPTEAEWEYTAAGGRPGARFPWGDAEPDDVAFQPCNIWQGQFPSYNSGRDGYLGTAPVDAFAANGYGLFNMSGNTWEWCADRFRVRSVSRAAQARNRQAREGEERLLKGGSYLCHRSSCYRYRIAARTGAGADSSTAHVGFRLVFDDEPNANCHLLTANRPACQISSSSCRCVRGGNTEEGHAGGVVPDVARLAAG